MGERYTRAFVFKKDSKNATMREIYMYVWLIVFTTFLRSTVL